MPSSRSARILAVSSLLALLAAAPPAGAQPPPEGDKQACKNGGYQRVVGIGDPNETPVIFRNQGQCVSFVNHGGMLRGISDPEDSPPAL
jgi:hypothetical protein